MKDHSTIKIQKFLAQAGFGSRRKVETELIAAGRVTVNGKVAHVGQRIDPLRDEVRVDGERVRPQEKLYIVMNKPPGYLCSTRSIEGRPRVYDLLPKELHHLHTVGRLDFNSEGLLIFTNDGDFTELVTRRDSHVPREYEVKLRGLVKQRLLEVVARGARLEDGFARPLLLEVMRYTRTNVWVRVVVDEGRNRLVRRLMEHFGLMVVRLKRVAFGPLRLGRLPQGAFRYLSPGEVQAMREAALAWSETRKRH